MTEPPTTTASLWRRQPYRPMFATGFALAWAGVLHWLLFALQLSPEYRREFHALVQIQGLLTAFAGGFLLTMIPRRTGTAPPGPGLLLVAIAAPFGLAIAAWCGQIALAEGLWIVLLAALIGFVVRRFTARDAGRRPPNAFVWIPLSFLAGAGGALLIGAHELGWTEDPALYRFGWLAVTQVMFLGLIVGVGTMLLPLITRGESSVDAAGSVGDRRERTAHAVAWLALLASCAIEAGGWLRAAFALRLLVVLVALLLGTRLHHLPTVPGLHRRLVWLAGWAIPLGYLLAVLLPDRPQVGLHTVFIGGFALMAFAVGLHVTLAHGGDPQLARATTTPVPVFGGLLLLAVVFRALVDLDPARRSTWLALAAGSFLLGTLAWAWLALPRLLRAGGSQHP